MPFMLGSAIASLRSDDVVEEDGMYASQWFSTCVFSISIQHYIVSHIGLSVCCCVRDNYYVCVCVCIRVCVCVSVNVYMRDYAL